MSVSTKLRRPAEPEISQMWLHFLKGVKQPKWEAEKASTTPIIRRLTSIPPQPQHAFLAKLLKYLLQSSGKNVDIKILLEGRNTVSQNAAPTAEVVTREGSPTPSRRTTTEGSLCTQLGESC